MRIQNPFTEKEMDAVYMQLKITALMHININDDFKVIGNV